MAGGELRVGVERRFVHTPVVAGAPVVDQVAQVVEGYAVRPADGGQFVGPARATEPLTQVVETVLGNSDAERLDQALSAHRLNVQAIVARFGPQCRKFSSTSGISDVDSTSIVEVDASCCRSRARSVRNGVEQPMQKRR